MKFNAKIYEVISPNWQVAKDLTFILPHQKKTEQYDRKGKKRFHNP